MPKKYNDNLEALTDVGNSGGQLRLGRTKRSDTGDSDDDFGTDSDSGSGGSAGDDPLGGIGRDVDGGAFSAPGGSGRAARAADPFRNSGTRARGRRGSGGSARGGASVDTGTGTEKGTRTSDETAPREVKIHSLSGAKASAKNEVMAKEFLAEGFVLLFDIAGTAMHDKETWSLEKDGDASELADRTINWFRSLDKKRSANFEKVIAKWQPFLFLLMALVAIIGPRYTLTMSKRRAVNPSKKANTGNAGHTAAAPASVKADVVQSPVGNDAGPGTPNGNGQIYASERPLRREDFIQLFGESNG